MAERTTTVTEYMSRLEPERADAMERLLEVIRRNLPAGFEEVMSYGMPGYVVPYSIYPSGYHCGPKQPLPFLGIASKKSHIGLYHMGLYADAGLLAWFTEEYAKRVPSKLDMGKSCVCFKKPSQIPFELLGELVAKMTPADWINCYERCLKR